MNLMSRNETAETIGTIIALPFVIAFVYIGVALVMAAVGLIFAFPVMWLWNEFLVPAAPGVATPISFWGGWGIYLLASLLFKSSSVSTKKDD